MPFSETCSLSLNFDCKVIVFFDIDVGNVWSFPTLMHFPKIKKQFKCFLTIDELYIDWGEG